MTTAAEIAVAGRPTVNRAARLLAELPALSPGSAPPRREILRRITEIEAALT